MQQQIKQLNEWLDDSQHLVFFGGAGVSTESGIPDFRSSKGLYMKDSGYNIPAEEIISHHFYLAHPEIFFPYYFEHLVFPDAKPNACHRYLADYEQQARKHVNIVTQNIDGLHQKAGSQRVTELHGSVWRNYCEAHQHFYDYESLPLDNQQIPHCPEDGSIIKPDVVLYEESLDETAFLDAITAIQAADLLIVAGTSLSVYPAAGLINYFRGEHLVVINRTPVPVDNQASLVITEDIGGVFEQLTIN
ncbi:MAG: NAD-dependent protein deacylase [Aerococcus sp.]|nr:NAD-dependent protein deacylase [Aerococcus sp.]